MTTSAGEPEPASPNLNKAANEGVYASIPEPERVGPDLNRAVPDPVNERVISSV